jgi:hypothetical protein
MDASEIEAWTLQVVELFQVFTEREERASIAIGTNLPFSKTHLFGRTCGRRDRKFHLFAVAVPQVRGLARWRVGHLACAVGAAELFEGGQGGVDGLGGHSDLDFFAAGLQGQYLHAGRQVPGRRQPLVGG